MRLDAVGICEGNDWDEGDIVADATLESVGAAVHDGHIPAEIFVRPVVGQSSRQGHSNGELMPFEGQWYPIGHGWHALMLDAPIKGLYVPPTQAVIALEAVVQNDPDGHVSKYATIVMPGFVTDESVKSFATSEPPHSE
jgi:hypothetical protein